MKNNLKSVLSLLLSVVMILSIVPSFMLTSYATETKVTTHDVDQIRELLRSDGDVSITLDADAEKKLVAYSDFEEGLLNSQLVWARIGSGKKTLNLNGHRIYIYDQSARSLGSTEWLDFRYVQKATLMEIPSNASVIVNDSTNKGLIWMDS